MREEKITGFAPGMAGNYFPALTGIRALAAFMVYCHHFNPFAGGTFLFGIANELHIGVTIFFVLSGFLICYRYFDHFELSKKWLKDYFLYRLARIYPIYFLLTTVTFLFFFFDEGWSNKLVFRYFLSITFLKGFFELFKFSGIAQSWSLTVEECFYLAAPVFFLLYKWKKAYLFLVLPAFLTIGLLLVAFFSKFDFYGLFSSVKFMLIYTFFGRCAEFLAGALLAVYLKSGKAEKLKSNLGLFTIAGSGMILISLAGFRYLKGAYSYSLHHPLGLVLNNFILPVFISVLFLGLITENSLFRKILVTPLFRTLGKSSYIFYLIHLGAIQAFIKTLIGPDFLLSFLVFNLLSLILFYLVEQPVNKQIRALTRRHRHFPA
jgi:peptidoglycan/LPS O-acetylase OafA/YrhL